MKSLAKNMLAAGIAFISLTVVSAQQQYTSSDVSISALTLSPAGALKKVAAKTDNVNATNHAPVTIEASNNILKCTITVHNGSGFARQVTLVVLVPVDVTIVSNPSNAVINKTGDQNRFGMPGSLVFDLFNMSAGLDNTVEFTFTKSVQGNKIGAYVYSACPDPDPTNNYKNAVY